SSRPFSLAGARMSAMICPSGPSTARKSDLQTCHGPGVWFIGRTSKQERQGLEPRQHRDRKESRSFELPGQSSHYLFVRMVCEGQFPVVKAPALPVHQVERAFLNSKTQKRSGRLGVIRPFADLG